MTFEVRQAVILCGGLGERLWPLTAHCPKPMVEVNGRPFLHHLLDQLSRNGISSFLLLTGYLGDQISGYFGTGSEFGWTIQYSHGPANWTTSQRLQNAIEQVDDTALLMYSDNYAHVDFSKLSLTHFQEKFNITLSVARKSPGNVALNQGVATYSRDRGFTQDPFVEVGYMVINFKAIRRLLFEERIKEFADVIQKVGETARLGAVEIRGDYLSISDKSRLELTIRYFAGKKILLLDRDGTINRTPVNGRYVLSVNDFHWLENSRTAIHELARLGFTFVVITNQAGIATGDLDPDVLQKVHEKMRNDFEDIGAHLLDIYSCYAHWNSNDPLRKPNPGMFFQASKDHQFLLERTIYVGDDWRDVEAAGNAGCMSALVGVHSNMDLPRLSTEPNFRADNLLDLVPLIARQYDMMNEW